jgi:predicted porin
MGLGAARYGTLSLGRQGDTAIDFVASLVHGLFWGNLAIHPADYDNLNFSHRINNSIKYSSDSFGGLRFGMLYSFGGVPGSLG